MIRIAGQVISGLLLLLLLTAGVAVAREIPLATPAGSGLQVDAGQVSRLLATYLEVEADNLPAARFRFRSLENPGTFLLPAGRTTCEVVPADPAIIGSRRFTLIYRVDDRVVRNLALHAELEALAPVAVASLDLPRGAVLAAGDVRLDQRNLAELREPLLATEGLVGLRLRRALKAGEALEKPLLETPPLIHRGDLVTLTVHSGALLLTARGVARDNGVAGATIRVRNNTSQREVLGRVSGPGQVNVEL